MILSIDVHNFKSWKHAEAIQFADITGFFGSNSSGKSSLLHLLILLKRTAESSDRGQLLEFRRPPDGIDFGSFSEVLHNHSLDSALRFSITYKMDKPLRLIDPSSNKPIPGIDNRVVTFSCAIRQVGDESLVLDEMLYESGSHTFGMQRDQTRRHYKLIHSGPGFEFIRARGRPWDLTAPVRFYKFSDQVTFRYQNAEFLSEFESSLKAALESVYHLGPLRDLPLRRYSYPGGEPADLGPKGERWMDALLAARSRGRDISPGWKRRRVSLEERVAYWLQKMGLIHSFEVERISEDSNLYRAKVKRTKASAAVLLPDVGFGVSQVLPVLITLFYVPEGSTVLLEQPEIHLHPAVQSELADALIDAVINRNIQLVIESHSEHLLHRLQRRIAEDVVAPEQVTLYFVDKDAAGRAEALELDVDMFGTIRNWPKDFFGDQVEDLAEAARAAAARRASAK